MDWRQYWNHYAQQEQDGIAQVQRKDESSIQDTAAYIVEKLAIESHEVVLDVCCGNGLLTEKMGAICHKILGVDQAENLIQYAVDLTTLPNVKFILSKAENITQHIEKESIDKIYLAYSFQYFDKKQQGLLVVQEMLKVLKPGGKILISDIPDAAKESSFYNTLLKKFFRITSLLRNKNSMGKFWHKKELIDITQKLGVKGTVLNQPEHLPYAWYRFDFLISNQ
jgi:ubiquinone/menaquinone biosynthesis C-methylase UbiE